MKKIFTLFIGLFIVVNSFAQKVDYESSTDWFWGVNMGAAWNTTDVENRTNLGWSFLLGKQFNSNYGRIVSFDLRMRYLRSNWRGLDGDTTSLVNYTPQYIAPEYQAYQANPGYVVNNFKTRVHELGLELVLHANRLRERTGWDPYIFGGANITWSQTFGDLINLDSTLFSYGQYDYTGDLTKSSIKAQLDGDYETALNESSLDEGWNVDFMPSLGVGLGYQVSPRVSLGVEWKTTFALRDDWDGFENPEKQWGLFKNDVYHYTNGYIRIQIGKHNKNVNIQQPDNTQPDNTQPNINTPVQPICNDPEIYFINPTRNNLSVEAQLYVLNARLKYVTSRQQIHVYVNNIETTNYYFNANTGDLDGNINLIEGQNTIKITATNACGTDVESTGIIYETCKNPIINFTAPSHTNFNVDEDVYTVRANILNGATSVSYSFNGLNTQNFNYNSTTGIFESNTTLVRGNNTVVIVATNACGTVTQTVVLNHADCADPFVQFSTPVNTISTENNFTITAAVMNVASKDDIGFRVNGMNKTFSFKLSSSVLQALVSLKEGENTIEIFASNTCGSESETITIVYEPCKNPVINFTVPSAQISETAIGSQAVQAMVSGLDGINDIQLVLNGIVISGGTYSSLTGEFQHNVRLLEGVNTISITATNGCGTVTQTVTITFNACNAPTIGLINPNALTSTQTEISLSVNASVTGVESVNQIQLIHNNNILNGGTYSAITNFYQKTVTLAAGMNTFLILSTNECGTQQQEFKVELEEIELEEFIQVCLKGRDGAQTLEIPLAQWATYQQQGAVLGPCPDVEDVVVEMITICHNPSGRPNAGQAIEIPLSEWAIHQEHGDVIGECPVVEEEKIMICHKPPGNPDNTQEIEIPISAWAAHQAHGDNLGPCPVVEVEEEDDSGSSIENEEIENENGFGGGGVIISNNGDNNEEEEEEKIMICHKPPGNPDNTQEIEIPISAWAAHQAHGDNLGPCPVIEQEEVEEEEIIICHKTGKKQEEITIPISAWAKHQAHGDNLGPCRGLNEDDTDDDDSIEEEEEEEESVEPTKGKNVPKISPTINSGGIKPKENVQPASPKKPNTGNLGIGGGK